MKDRIPSASLLDFIVERINVGIVVVDQNMNIVLWNKFMEMHSGRSSYQLLGRNLFESFPELPHAWMERKIKSVFILKNYAFSSWQQRPYLFRFSHHRPITGGVDFMRQDCTFLPVKDEEGQVNFVCITLVDATDTSIYQNKLNETMALLEDLSQRDGLTGIYNRRQLEEQLAGEFKRYRRYGEVFSFILADLDRFKKINDTYGHLAGDEVLCHVAHMFVDVLRDTDIVARYGGEEFAAILYNTTWKEAFAAAERVRLVIARQPILYKNQRIPITISIGVTQAHPEMQHHESLIQQADAALYASKSAGRNRTTCLGPGTGASPSTPTGDPAKDHGHEAREPPRIARQN